MLSEDLVSCPKQAVGKQTVPTLPKQAALLLGTVKYDLSTGQGEPIRVDFYKLYNRYKFFTSSTSSFVFVGRVANQNFLIMKQQKCWQAVNKCVQDLVLQKTATSGSWKSSV